MFARGEGRRGWFGGFVAVVVVLLGLVVVPSSALAASPWWHLALGSRPSFLEPEGKGELAVTVENVGDADVSAGGVVSVITDSLPGGLRVLHAKAAVVFANTRTPVTCTESASRVVCDLAEPLVPYGAVEVRIEVQVEEGAHTGELTEVSVSGGGAPEAVVSRPITVSGKPVPFGFEGYELNNEVEGGGVDSQAGSHPFQQTTSFELNETGDSASLSESADAEPAALPKDLDFKWPAGLIGNPTVVPQCTAHEFVTHAGGGDENGCPAASAVGVATVIANEPHTFHLTVFTVPLFNLEPLPGEPARLGFNIVEANAPVYIETALRTGGDYGVTVKSENITQTAGILAGNVTVWGVPNEAAHDNARGWGCLLPARGVTSTSSCPSAPPAAERPFLSLPTACTAPPLVSTVEGDSWADPGVFSQLASFTLPATSGCGGLPAFKPEVRVTTTGTNAATATGFGVTVHVPQEADEAAGGFDSPNIKDIAVTLPEGVSLNPSAADGLESCSEGQVGYLPGESAPGSGELHFTPGVASCPSAAKVANVTIHTPVLPHPLEGGMYLASPQNFASPPQENPFESLVAMYLIAEDPESGVLVKLPGRVSLNPTTGQITATFQDTPDLPFETAEVQFFGGERAPLATPAHCGTYTTNASFTPWAASASVPSSSSFNVTAGPGGGACPGGGALAFSPSLASGTSTPTAGAFSPLVTTLSRPDGDQATQSLTLHTPPGVSGVLTGVTLCDEAQANAGTCGAGSLIGRSTASVGVGGEPYTVTGGEVFLTEGYGGAPFGLSIVTPAVAGPFNLGKIVVRAKIEINPQTAELTVVVDNTGAYAIPHILDGILLQLKQVQVTIDRPAFTFNPTSCSPPAVTGTVYGDEGAAAAVTAPFKVTGCRGLMFAPKIQAGTSAKTSKADGASLTVKLSYPTVPQGTQADIAKVKVDLPLQLPSELRTLQKACLAAVFEANPANCPPNSIVGHATVTTPLIPVPLTGPAYFVSHGGEAFPSLTMVLQGYGITIKLVGSTLIRKGITSTTFNTVPDVPFNTFQLTLPEGAYPALAANGNLCEPKLMMPTAFQAQNGAEIHQDTPITVQGCPKTLTIWKHKLTKHTLTISIYAPGPGKITATSPHTTKTTRTTQTAETIILTLKTKTGRHTTRIKITYTPHTGKHQTHTITLKT